MKGKDRDIWEIIADGLRLAREYHGDETTFRFLAAYILFVAKSSGRDRVAIEFPLGEVVDVILNSGVTGETEH